MATTLEHKLTALIEPLLADQGLELVQLSILGEGRGMVLQILAEDPKTGTLDLDSCTRLSRTIGTHLEVEDVIKSAYRLEISSPGIDRPLTRPAHYKKFTGFEVKIDTHMPINNQKRYHGHIVDADDHSVTIQTDTKTVTLEFTDIARAKLKLTDALIRAARPANLNTSDETNTPEDQQEGDAEK